MNKLDRIKNKFYKFEEESIDLYLFGKFNIGLTNEEIVDYIRVRANKYKVKGLVKSFYKIAGTNTVGLYICSKCKDEKILMYRHDVKRFADVLFKVTKSTYWD